MVVKHAPITKSASEGSTWPHAVIYSPSFSGKVMTFRNNKKKKKGRGRRGRWSERDGERLSLRLRGIELTLSNLLLIKIK